MNGRENPGSELELDVRDLEDEDLEYILDAVERGLDQLKEIGPRTAPTAFYSLMFVKTVLKKSLRGDSDHE